MTASQMPESLKAPEELAAIQQALAQFPGGWHTVFDEVREREPGVVEIGAIWEDSDSLAEVITIDTGNYYDNASAMPVAKFVAACKPAALTAVLTHISALQAALNDRDAEIERLKKDAGCKWLPIAGAPKDGACVLVNDTSGLFTDYCMAKWLQGDEWSGWVYDDEATADNNPLGPQPTHFMLIPAIDSMKGKTDAS